LLASLARRRGSVDLARSSTEERARKSSSCFAESHLALLEKAELDEARTRFLLASPASERLDFRQYQACSSSRAIGDGSVVQSDREQSPKKSRTVDSKQVPPALLPLVEATRTSTVVHSLRKYASPSPREPAPCAHRRRVQARGAVRNRTGEPCGVEWGRPCRRRQRCGSCASEARAQSGAASCALLVSCARSVLGFRDVKLRAGIQRVRDGCEQGRRKRRDAVQQEALARGGGGGGGEGEVSLFLSVLPCSPFSLEGSSIACARRRRRNGRKRVAAAVTRATSSSLRRPSPRRPERALGCSLLLSLGSVSE